MNRLELEISTMEKALADVIRDRDKLEEQAQRKNEIENEHKGEIE